jgi:hypothetical protein
MVLPRTKPLDGEFWYILDDQNDIDWKPRPKLRGDFYLGWLGQNKNVVGAGLARLEQGQVTHICTHGALYYWLQPYQVLPFTVETIRAQQVSVADTMVLDYSLAGWGLRDQTPPTTRSWPDAPVSTATLRPLLGQTIMLIVHSFRSEGEPPPPPKSGGLLDRTTAVSPPDPQEELLDQLKGILGESNVGPVLIELVRHDVNVTPSFRKTGLFESLPTEEQLPPPNKVARLVLSAIYHLAPFLGSPRLSNALLLNSLRQRHPFDVTWGADFLVKCLGMPNLVRVLQAALVKERDVQIRGNVLDLLQELGYGSSVGLGGEVLSGLADLLGQESLGAFGQVINPHLSFLQEYMRQRDAAANLTG